MAIFRCDNHDFGTDLPSEWKEHTAEFPHTYRGVTACEQCGTEVTFEKKAKLRASRAVPLILCEECKDDDE